MTHPIVARLRSDDPAQRAAACRDAVLDPSAVILLEALGDALDDPDRGVARAASDALYELGTRVEGVHDVLRRALHGSRQRARWRAAFTSARLTPPGPKLLPPLVEALGDDDPDVRWSAARLLVETGRVTGEVLPLLLGLARSEDRPIARRMVTYCLRELAPEAPESAAAFLHASRDPDLRLRRASFTGLAALLAPPPEVVPRLVEALESEPDGACRRIAALAIGAIGARDRGLVDQSAVDALRRARTDVDDPDLRRAAGRALERVGTLTGGVED